MQWRINGQFIMEGLLASFMFTLGAIGFIILDRANKSKLTAGIRLMMFAVGLSSIIISFIATRFFMKLKMPYVLIIYYILFRSYAF